MADIEIEFAPPLARMRFNRPQRRNALTREMWLGSSRRDLRDRSARRRAGVLVEGAGGHFCVGADISEFDAVYADAASTRDYLAAIETGLSALARLDRPTIALLEGSSIGGGLAIALCLRSSLCGRGRPYRRASGEARPLYGPVETRRLVN